MGKGALKKGSAELLILALLEEREHHGYEIGRLIEARSEGALTFHVASLYPILYRLEGESLIEGRWVEKPGRRRRRHYRLTDAGRRRLAQDRKNWKEFINALNRITGLDTV